ncbi:MAG: hemolysin III family protein [Planctomycetes bacterium]|nr:hemolysin III family protein [Planctomycetota bacterium]
MCSIYATPLAGIREPFCSLSHVLGACVFTLLTVLLIRRGSGDRLRMISLGIMAYVCIQTLIISSIYHSLWPGPSRELMLRLDVAGIFLVIAGCITPVHVILFTGTERWAPLAVAWITAIGGAILRWRYFDSLPNVAGIAIFLVFGWGGAVTAAVLWRRHGWRFIRPAVFAGLSYTIGAIILLLHQPMPISGVVGPHELWHLAVLAGLGLHWRFVFQFADGDALDDAALLPIRVSEVDSLRVAASLKRRISEVA